MTQKPTISTPQAKQKNYTHIEQFVKQIAHYGRLGLVFTNHMKDSMMKRNFTTSDVLKVLAAGSLIRKREFDDTYKNWKYHIEGEDIEGEKLTLIFSITEEEDALILITGC